ncbi:hypothetical protein A4R29_31115 (plasmid) [Mesorhizobium ciceri biovar biserrulae]|nr:hypothetical protein A4R29_31115 [Mesorhizobium ciceri biovar biserrulae]
MASSPRFPATYKQLPLDLGIEVEKDVNGIEMGVLENGMAYLTQSGLSPSVARHGLPSKRSPRSGKTNFGLDLQRGRSLYFSDYLRQAGYDEPTLFMEIQRNGSTHYAYPELVCMAFIEFFAFEAQRANDTALLNFRKLPGTASISSSMTPLGIHRSSTRAAAALASSNRPSLASAAVSATTPWVVGLDNKALASKRRNRSVAAKETSGDLPRNKSSTILLGQETGM